MLEHMTPTVVRTIARAGFEWIWIDNEHGHHSYETIFEVARTAEDVGLITLLRVTQGDYSHIAQALDMAVSGIIVPRVETPEEVRHIIDCAKYPPVGKRGFGMRSSLFGKQHTTMAERLVDQNENRMLIIQLESPRGVQNLEAMLEVADGQLDGIFYGPADYQVTVGRVDNTKDAEVVAAAKHITDLSKKHGLSNGTPATTVEAVRHWRDLGFNLITWKSDDQLLVDAAHEGREALRALEND